MYLAAKDNLGDLRVCFARGQNVMIFNMKLKCLVRNYIALCQYIWAVFQHRNEITLC